MKKFIKFLTILSFLFILVSCGDSNNADYIKVEFDTDGGTFESSANYQYVIKGDKAIEPDDPIKEGYTFKGWYYNDEEWSFIGYSITENITLTAKWEANTYFLTIEDYNNGETKIREIKCGTSLNNIPKPKKEGYTFIGWDEEIPTVMPAHSISIKALWKVNQYTLTIKYNDGVTEDKIITQDYNSYINIEKPTRIGYTFNKWSENITKMPAEDKTIEASWTINQYCITLKYNDDKTNNLNIWRNYGTEINVKNPTRIGYTFVGWSEEIPSTMPANNMEIEAIWKINQYTLTLKYNDGTTKDKIIIQDYNSNISIDTPTRVGYSFVKWSETIPLTMPAEDKTIEANWIINQYTLTLRNYYGTSDKIIKQDYNTRVSISNPTRVGYSFVKWSETIPLTMPAENKTIEANWKINKYTLTIKYNDGVTSDNIITQDYNTKINITDPTRTGYTFVKWSETIPSTMPAENKTIEASWMCHVNYIVKDNYIEITGHNVNSNILILNSYEGYPVKNIGDNAFNNCTGLTSIEIPSSVTSIGNYAFSGCTSLTNIEIPSNVTNIGSYAFNGCTSLISIVIPNSVTSMSYATFQNCTSLTSITLPFVGNQLINPTNNHFGYIFGVDTNKNNYYEYVPTSLKEVIITGGTSIGEQAFSGCSNLTSIEIPNSTANIGISAFSGCKNLTNIKIPSTITCIPDSTFSGCKSLTNIEIPNTITSIGSFAFSGCESLANIKIPNSITNLSNGIFYDCAGLKNIEIPSNVTSIENYAFYGCKSLTSIEIPVNVKNLSNGIFHSCTSLKSIKISSNISSIGDHAFYECAALTSITIPNSVTSIGNYAFYKCTGLTSITILDTINSIGKWAFYGCTNLTNIEIPASLTYIEERAFLDCKNLTNINFNGTKIQWEAITKGVYWNYGTGNYTIHCTDENITK